MGIAERKAREKKQRQESIIDAAESVFIQKGYHAMTMEIVAEAVEINKATIYLYFQNKSDLFHAIVDRSLNTLLIMLKLTSEEQKTGLQQTLAFIDNYIDFCREHPHYCAAINHREENKRDISSKEAKVPFDFKTDETAKKIFTLIIDAITQGKSDGTIRQDIQPDIATVLIWGLLVGTMQMIENKQEMIHDLLGLSKEHIFKELSRYMIQTLKA
jgi:TetR/AcrR family transcriptional regulator